MSPHINLASEGLTALPSFKQPWFIIVCSYFDPEFHFTNYFLNSKFKFHENLILL